MCVHVRVCVHEEEEVKEVMKIGKKMELEVERRRMS